ncbi:MAG: hypothetical protein Q4C97_11975 [Bacillota bacterium]|nr:hypothetical protein [Bacillota bacterium]
MKKEGVAALSIIVLKAATPSFLGGIFMKNIQNLEFTEKENKGKVVDRKCCCDQRKQRLRKRRNGDEVS